MPFYHEITVWTRGIIMDKEARDVANALTQAARLEGRYTQFISDYVDAPDRTNCLIRKYGRMSDEEIKFKFIYENERPNIVVLIEETLVKAVNYTRKTPPGEGVVVVNTHRDPEYIWRFLPDPSKLSIPQSSAARPQADQLKPRPTSARLALDPSSNPDASSPPTA